MFFHGFDAYVAGFLLEVSTSYRLLIAASLRTKLNNVIIYTHNEVRLQNNCAYRKS